MCREIDASTPTLLSLPMILTGRGNVGGLGEYVVASVRNCHQLCTPSPQHIPAGQGPQHTPAKPGPKHIPARPVPEEQEQKEEGEEKEDEVEKRKLEKEITWDPRNP